jgi:hypothetical protein
VGIAAAVVATAVVGCLAQSPGPPGFRPPGDGGQDAAATDATDGDDAPTTGGSGGAGDGGGGSGGGAGAGGGGSGSGGGGGGDRDGAVTDGGPSDVPPTDAQRSCTVTPSSCSCIDGIPPTEPPGPCNLTTVMRDADERAVCCKSSFGCSCTSYLCRSQAAPQICVCGVGFLVETSVEGPRVASCTRGGGLQHCCLSQSPRQCVCLGTTCAAGDIEVAECTPATLAACTGADQSVLACN